MPPDNTNQQYWNNQNQWPQQNQGLPEVGDLQQTNDNSYLSGVGAQTADPNQNHSMYNYSDPNRNEVSLNTVGLTILNRFP